MSNYEINDSPIKESQKSTTGQEVDKKIKNFQFAWEDIYDWEYEEEIDNFERIPRKGKRGGY